MKKALIIVDLQNDFIPGGSLAVKEGDQIIPLINQLVHADFNLKIATKDWHPQNHVSFATTHHKKVGETISANGIEQILWPVHCVQNSFGAEFAPGWDVSKIDKQFFKGTEQGIDSYSTFFDNQHLRSTGLADYLRSQQIDELYIAGLATDYCVKQSVFDARKLNFNTYVIVDACRPVNLSPEDEKRALKEMEAAGAHLTNSKKVLSNE